MKKHFWFPLVVLFLCSCQSHLQQLVEEAPLISVQVPMGGGDTLILSKSPTNIVSLAPNFTEIIYLLGAEDRLAARSVTTTFPEKVYELPEVNGYPFPEIEDLRSYKPEVVLVSPEVKAQYDFPDSLPIYSSLTDNLEQLYASIRSLGVLTE
ncbi:MAG: ABC transporter substrate-binding protein, partial [Bacteroidota bacterium]